MKKVLVGTLLSMLLVTGCQSQKAWVYTPNQFQEKQPLSSKKAVVPPFEDHRVNDNSDRLLLYMIPLFPFGWTDLKVPEGVPRHVFSTMWVNYKPTEDFPKALASELQNAQIFREAYFDFGRGDADLIVNGKILNTDYSGKIFSYGLSVYGPLFWYIGLPAGSASNDLSVELRCIEAKTNRQIFAKTYQVPTYSRIGWLYSMPNDFNYPDMLKDLYKEFLKDLSASSAQLQ